jgi:DNA transposition AAA+ family ATPase
MAFSQQQKTELLAVTATRRRDVLRRVKHYMAVAGMNTHDFAARIGYARATLNFFLNERYHHVSGNDSAICSAAVAYMDRNPLEMPTQAEGTLYETQNVKLIRHCFIRALHQHCAYYFRGAPGCQKTFVLEHLIAEVNREEAAKETPERRAFLIRCRIGIKPCDLLKRVAMAVGSVSLGNTDRIINNLRYELRKGKSLLVFDEAQFLSIECLETVRELLDIGIVGLLFAGSHQLEDIFDRIDMAQWRSRIRKGEGLPGLSLEEAQNIVKSELPKITQASMMDMISTCYEVDYYRGEKRRYISARLLFWAIDEIKLRKHEPARTLPNAVKAGRIV